MPRTNAPGWLFKTLVILTLAAFSAQAANLTFSGNFTHDDDVQLLNFSLGTDSIVTLRTWSYAGGINTAGNTVARGGFDPVISLFTSVGNVIGQNDDGYCGSVAADAVSGQCWDAFLQISLTSGSYTVAVTQADNYAVGPTLSDGFTESGQGNFTTAFGSCPNFNDLSGALNNCRDGHWAVEILGIDSGGPSPVVPEPAIPFEIAIGLALIATLRVCAFRARQ